MGFGQLAWMALVAAEGMGGVARPHVQIQVYDYASVGAVPLRSFVDGFDGVLRQSGLDVEVTLCRGFGAVACESEGDLPDHLTLRILGGDAGQMKNVRRRPLGQSLAGPTGGSQAELFLGAARDQAAAADVPWPVVLAHAAAHEVGHLLLGSGAHTPWGLMKPAWERPEYQAMFQNRLHFTPEQVRRMRVHP